MDRQLAQSIALPLAETRVAVQADTRTNSGRFSLLDPDKLRGGYYTSSDLADWLCQWAIREPKICLLEPSCGDGSFLEAAVHRFAALGVKGAAAAERLFGIEIIPDEADKARARLRPWLGARVAAVVETGDYFEWSGRPARPRFDAVVGNPPFIRYQSFPEPHRTRAMEIMKGMGLSPNRLTNIWVPFVVAAAASLRPGGRLALVLPAELLQVSYASQLRSFLTDRFDRISLVTCNELFFERAEQEVVLLLAEGAREAALEDRPCQVTLTECETVEDIVRKRPSEVLAGASPKSVQHDSEKWLKYLLTASEIAFMRELRVSTRTTTLDAFGSVDVGVVTGKNEFFVLRDDDLTQLRLGDYTVPLISRSVHLSGAKIGRRDWKSLAMAGDRVHLLHLAPLNGAKLPAPLERYIRRGEAEKVHEGYKCSIRNPWYAVPATWIPDAFFFRQIYDFPRVVLNKAGATSTDTIHRLRCKTEHRPKTIVENMYTHLTAASAEIEGRSYGGGVLELEPTEAERLMVPAKLANALPIDECDRLIRQGRLDDVLLENDRLILRAQLGLTRSDCKMLREIWEKMRNRRLARRRRRPKRL